MSPLAGILIVVAIFASIVVWLFRRHFREARGHHEKLTWLATSLGAERPEPGEHVQLLHEGRSFEVGVTEGGDGPDSLGIRTLIDPLPDGFIFLFVSGIQRWFAHKVHTGDPYLDSILSYNEKLYQKHPRREEFVARLLAEGRVRDALLRISRAGYKRVTIPGRWKEDTLAARVGSILSVPPYLVAAVDDPKPEHFEPGRVEDLVGALHVLAEAVPQAWKETAGVA